MNEKHYLNNASFEFNTPESLQLAGDEICNLVSVAQELQDISENNNSGLDITKELAPRLQEMNPTMVLLAYSLLTREEADYLPHSQTPAWMDSLLEAVHSHISDKLYVAQSVEL